MNEKYNKLFALPENLYNSSAPIVISSGYLLKDNETEKIIAQIKKSYDSICKGVKNKQIEIKLDPICNFSSKEEKVYKNIL